MITYTPLNLQQERLQYENGFLADRTFDLSSEFAIDILIIYQ